MRTKVTVAHIFSILLTIQNILPRTIYLTKQLTAENHAYSRKTRDMKNFPGKVDDIRSIVWEDCLLEQDANTCFNRFRSLHFVLHNNLPPKIFLSRKKRIRTDLESNSFVSKLFSVTKTDREKCKLITDTRNSSQCSNNSSSMKNSFDKLIKSSKAIAGLLKLSFSKLGDFGTKKSYSPIRQKLQRNRFYF